MRAPAVLLTFTLLAGCMTLPGAVETPDPAPASELRVGAALLHTGGVQGGLSLLHLAEGGAATVSFPEGVLVLDERGMLVAADAPVEVAEGRALRYLPPYGATSLTVQVASGGASAAHEIPLEAGEPFVDGDRVVELLKVQRDQFPHRTPGMPNYDRSIEYFATFFADLGYEVEVFATPLPDIQLPVSPGPGTGSVKSVVAVKHGVEQPDRYLAFGGHFDVVEETTHGAFDNTGGTMATLALAEAFAGINTSRSVIFAAWGGEEDGILGSQAWLTAHPELVPLIDLYVNFDVTGLAWPAPLVDPANVVYSTGPDGPVGDALAAQHRDVAATWLQLGADPFVYQPIAQGQATGAGVNAQSDHTPFMARGVPVVFQFTERVGDILPLIHTESDTVENMARYALLGTEGVDLDLNATEMQEGDAALARSFETQMVGGFYHAILTDGGLLPSTRPASLPSVPPLANIRS